MAHCISTAPHVPTHPHIHPRTYTPHPSHTPTPQTQQLDERIENVVFRVEEFKAQLAHMHTNISSTSDKMRHLHDNSEQLKTLYTRIDQVEVRWTVGG